MTAEQETLREKAIAAMADVAEHAATFSWTNLMTAAFDALHGIVRVVPLKPTEEMLRSSAGMPHNSSMGDRYYAMAEAGDLTRAGAQ
jgi:hypothetical protein